MKRMFFLLSTVILLTACNNTAKTKSDQAATEISTDLVRQNLKGKVKTITETSLTIDSTGKETTYTSFDEKGDQTDQQTKNGAGKVITQQFASRNANGLATEFGTKKNGKVVSRVVTEIEDGKYIGGKSYDSTGQQDGYYKDLKQNEYAIVYAGKRYGLNNKLKEEWEMKYDKNHFLGGKSKDSTGKITYEGTANVNDKGDMSEEDYKSVENGKSKSEKKTYKYGSYDSQGNWTERTAYNDKGKRTAVVKRSFTYY